MAFYCWVVPFRRQHRPARKPRQTSAQSYAYTRRARRTRTLEFDLSAAKRTQPMQAERNDEASVPAIQERDPFVALRTWFMHWPPLALTGVALLVATLIRLALDQAWPARFAFAPYFPAILLCAVVAGWRQGLLATAASAGLVLALYARDWDSGLFAGI